MLERKLQEDDSDVLSQDSENYNEEYKHMVQTQQMDQDEMQIMPMEDDEEKDLEVPAIQEDLNPEDIRNLT